MRESDNKLLTTAATKKTVASARLIKTSKKTSNESENREKKVKKKMRQ